MRLYIVLLSAAFQSLPANMVKHLVSQRAQEVGSRLMIVAPKTVPLKEVLSGVEGHPVVPIASDQHVNALSKMM